MFNNAHLDLDCTLTLFIRARIYSYIKYYITFTITCISITIRSLAVDNPL